MKFSAAYSETVSGSGPRSLFMGWRLGAGLSAIRATAAGQRLDPLDLFARLLINGGVAEVDVPVQARVRVVLDFGGWVRGRMLFVHSDLQVCVGRVPGSGCSCGTTSLFDTSYYTLSITIHNP